MDKDYTIKLIAALALYWKHIEAIKELDAWDVELLADDVILETRRLQAGALQAQDALVNLLKHYGKRLND